MRLFITGGAGYIGTRLQYFSRDHFIYDIRADPRQDILDYDYMLSCAEAYQPSLIIHLAALSDVVRCEENKNEAWRQNVTGTKNVCLLAATLNCPLLFASSCAVYGSCESFATEETIIQPSSVYACSKMAGEHLIYAQNLRATILRLFNVVGYSPVESCESRLFPKLFEAQRNHVPFVIAGNDYNTFDGTAVRDYVWLDDVCRAMMVCGRHLLSQTEKKTNVFNVCSGMGQTVAQICSYFPDLILSYGPRRDGDVESIVGSNEKLYQYCALSAETDMKRILQSFTR